MIAGAVLAVVAVVNIEENYSFKLDSSSNFGCQKNKN
jgi:hypothetical protein